MRQNFFVSQEYRIVPNLFSTGSNMDLLPLAIALLVLLVDSAIELALISSMVGFLHRSGANQYPFDFNGETFLLNAKPKGLLVDQGHTSNGAAGTCLVAICFGGFIVLWLQRRRARNGSSKPSKLFLAYTILSVLSFLLTTAALAYTFTLTNQTKGHKIDPAVASQVQSHAYPKDHWTPETWTKAMLALPITSETDRSYLRHWVRVMEGWKWNLIPMFLIDLSVTSLIVSACLQDRKLSKASRGGLDGEQVHDKNVVAT